MKTITALSAAALSLGVCSTAVGTDNRQSAAQRRAPTQPQPASLPEHINPDQLRPLPGNMPIRRVTVRPGQKAEYGGVAGATGTLVYKNTLGANYFAPGANVQVADDLQLIAVAGCDLSFVEVMVTGGGDGTGPGFSVDFALYTGCPGQGGTVIQGTEGSAVLGDNGYHLVSIDLEGAEVSIPPEVWLALKVSTTAAGWVVGRPAEVGFTANVFHAPAFPCNAWFGGTPYAGFYAEMYCGGNVATQFEAYRSDAFSGFFDEVALTEQWADDIVPITSPGNCDFVRYDSQLAGAAGAFTMKMELWTNDTVDLTPLAPVVGTTKNCSGAGLDGAAAPTVCSHAVFPPITIPTPEFWMVYDVSNHAAGPMLAADFPALGTSADAFAIFGNPDPGQWSQAVWFYGGCPGDANDPTPCGTFINTIQCAGATPVGACCDPTSAGGIPCVDGVSVVQCNGRWILAATCAVDPFNPPCGTAACCKPDETCENLTSAACDAAGGLWQPGAFCGEGSQSCPPPACITATNACSEVNERAAGCADPICCRVVCALDSFCCEVAYDTVCVSLAAQFCPEIAPNDACAAAIAVGDGMFGFDTTLATTDGLPLPDSCDEGFGTALGQDVWYDYTASLTGLATIDLCAGTAYDSRIAIYAGCSCPASNTDLLACSDDSCGDPIIAGGASGADFPIIAGQCYKIRIGGFGAATGTGYATIMSVTTQDIFACCMLDGACQDLDQVACDALNGLWHPGQLCGVGGQQCPPPLPRPTLDGNLSDFRSIALQIAGGAYRACAAIQVDNVDNGPPAGVDGFQDEPLQDNANPQGRYMHSPINVGDFVLIYVPDSDGLVEPPSVDDSWLGVGVNIANGDGDVFDSLNKLLTPPDLPANIMVPFDADGNGDPCVLGTGANGRWFPDNPVLTFDESSEAITLAFRLCAMDQVDLLGASDLEVVYQQRFQQATSSLLLSVDPTQLQVFPPVGSTCAQIKARGLDGIEAFPDGRGNDDFEFIINRIDSQVLTAYPPPSGRTYLDWTRYQLANLGLALRSDASADLSNEDSMFVICHMDMPNDDCNNNGIIDVCEGGTINCLPGSCCQPDGSCTETLTDECVGGVWTVNGACTPNACPQPGACCIGDGTCSFTLSSGCTSGQWTEGLPCDPNPCPPVGSCCGGDGSCAVTTEADCVAGQWTDGAGCLPNACPQPGSCCVDDGSCTVTFAVDCPTGVWRLHGDCAATDCVAQPAVEAVGSRYLAITPSGDSAVPLTLRVTSPAWPCLGLYVDSNGLLVDEPIFRTPAQWGTMYVGDSQIIPQTIYQVTAENGTHASPPATATTWRYGDANNSGVVNLDDILCVLSGFGGAFGDCTLYGVDSIGAFFNPDHTVSLDDILAVLAAFGGTQYTASTPCGP